MRQEEGLGPREEKRIAIFIVDEHPLFRAGVRCVCEHDPLCVVAGEAANGLEAVQFVLNHAVDVVLMDVGAPVADGVTACRLIKRARPDVWIVALTVHDRDVHLFQMIKAGVSAYLLKKDTDPALLLRAVHGVVKGESYLSPSLAGRVVAEFARVDGRSPAGPGGLRLTARESEILTLVGAGHANRIIALKLGISERTVKNHLTRIFAKIGVPNRTHAALYALNSGLRG